MITSNANKRVKLIKSLSSRKGRSDSELFIVEGQRFVSEIPSWVEIEFYALSDKFIDCNTLRENVDRQYFSKEIFERITDTASPQGVLAVCRKLKKSTESFFSDYTKGLFVILESISDPGNLGTIVRTADAFGAYGIILTGNSVDIYNPKVLRSTMGSIFRVPFISVSLEIAIRELKRRNIAIIGTSSESGNNCFNADFDAGSAVIIGNEAFGMSDNAKKICDTIVKIPMEGGAESLNAAMAAAVIMYEAMRQRLS